MASKLDACLVQSQSYTWSPRKTASPASFIHVRRSSRDRERMSLTVVINGWILKIPNRWTELQRRRVATDC